MKKSLAVFLAVLATLSMIMACSPTVGGEADPIVPVVDPAVAAPIATTPIDPAAPKRPLVISTNPANGALAIHTNTNISAKFDASMDTATIAASTFIVTRPDDSIVHGALTFAENDTIAIFDPNVDLAEKTIYRATVTTAAADKAGNTMANLKAWTFTTGTNPDTAPPTISHMIPVNGATGVVVNGEVTATFNETMDPSTLTVASFYLKGPGDVLVPGSVRYVGTTAIFTPTAKLAESTLYTARITTAVKDMANNSMVDAMVWSFTTSVHIAQGPKPVSLGLAGNYVILAKSGVSATVDTKITGNVGLSPAARTYMTGFSEALDPTNVFATSIMVTGKMYAANMAVPTPANLTTAISNMEAAYTDAAGRTLPDFTELGTGDISGLTLVPGLYKWGTGVIINSDVIISGSSNDVWIFQIAGDLTIADGKKIILSGGALPKNIFWQTFGVAALGNSSHMEGIIMAQTLISLKTGATVNGRLLAQTAVTLMANTVKQP